jgi:enoyl-CoA hydratase/carnithine racemase
MSFEEMLYDVDRGVATITFNRPEKLNAWTVKMQHELKDALKLATDDEAVRAIVITGAGKGFCSGADMARLQASSTGDKSAMQQPPLTPPGEGLEANFERRYSYILRVPKPVIAAINGACAGVGFVIPLYCDLRYIAEGARMGTVFVRRGMVAEHGMAWMLPRLIGTANALDLLLSGRMIEAREAKAMGLVNDVLPAEGFLEAVQTKARDLATFSSPRAMRIIKRQVYDAYFQNLAEATAIADAEIIKCRGTEDFKEGVAHFIEKRAPRFTGR